VDPSVPVLQTVTVCFRYSVADALCDTVLSAQRATIVGAIFVPEYKEQRCSTRSYRWVANIHTGTEPMGLFPHMMIRSIQKEIVTLTESGRGKVGLDSAWMSKGQVRRSSGERTGFVLRSPVPNDTPTTSKVKRVAPTLQFLFQRSHTQSRSMTELYVSLLWSRANLNSLTLHSQPICLRTKPAREQMRITFQGPYHCCPNINLPEERVPTPTRLDRITPITDSTKITHCWRNWT